MKPEVFTSALHAETARRRLSHRGLAHFLGRGKTAVTGWLGGTRFPAFTEFCELCEKFGWKLEEIFPPAIWRAAQMSPQEAARAEPDDEVYRAELLGLIMDALVSENPAVRHFALAVLEDGSLALTEKQAHMLASRLATLSKDKRLFLSSHYVLVANRLLGQTSAVVPFLGNLLVNSTNVLARYRVLAGFLDHPERLDESIHYVRSALLDAGIVRSEYEVTCLNLALAGPLESGSVCETVEAVRSHSREAKLFDLVQTFDAVMHNDRGEFAWYHVLDAVGRCRREGPALLINAYLALERLEASSDATNRGRDIAATINRSGTECVAHCKDFLIMATRSGDPWVAFHAVAALGKWAPRDASIVAALSATLARSAMYESEGETQVASLCCYALAKIGLATPDALASLTKARKTKNVWLKSVAKTAEASLRESLGLQDSVLRMLCAA